MLLDSGFVRIWGTDEMVVGAGFLVQSRYVLTCAHVVNQALGRGDEIREQPGGEERVSLDFPILDISPVQQPKMFKAQVLVWAPVEDNLAFQDIAVLEILDSMPPKTSPLSLKDHSAENALMVKGFPEKYNDGAIAPSVSVVGSIGRGLIQLHDEGESGILVSPGFSGAPVWDDTQQGAVGMLVITDPERQLAQMISAECLRYIFPMQVLAKIDFIAQGENKKSQAYHYAIPESWEQQVLPSSSDALIKELVDIPPENDVSALSKFFAYLLALRLDIEEESLAGLESWAIQKFSNFESLVQKAKLKIQNQHEQVRERDSERTKLHILISVQPSQDKYHVMMWKIPDIDAYNKITCAGIELLEQTELPIDRKEISGQVNQWVQQNWAEFSRAVIEVFLPLDLMGEPVDSWEIEDKYGNSVPLGAEYVVVTRSYERTLDNDKKKEWIDHWERKNRCTQMSSEVLVAGCLNPRELFGQLNTPRSLGFWLTTPPDKFGRGSIFSMMLRTAHPIAIWLRERPSGVNCEEKFMDFLDRCAIGCLPDVIKQQRTAALNEGSHVGNHLSLIWENPYVLPPIADEDAMYSNSGL